LSENKSINVLFSPNGGTQKRLVDAIASAKTSIDIAIYSFTAQPIFNSLVEAVKRGVKIRAVFDKSETHGAQAKFHDQLEQLGVPIKVLAPAGGIMHDKYIIIDDLILEWGSYNYTNRAELNNRENATFSKDPTLIAKYKANFNTMFMTADIESVRFRWMRRLIRAFHHS
jgi:phosphatidylserine/phosphatidylglycerophosphate/cardiolipin synthase-like enzyme